MKETIGGHSCQIERSDSASISWKSRIFRVTSVVRVSNAVAATMLSGVLSRYCRRRVPASCARRDSSGKTTIDMSTWAISAISSSVSPGVTQQFQLGHDGNKDGDILCQDRLEHRNHDGVLVQIVDDGIRMQGIHEPLAPYRGACSHSFRIFVTS